MNFKESYLKVRSKDVTCGTSSQKAGKGKLLSNEHCIVIETCKPRNAETSRETFQFLEASALYTTFSLFLQEFIQGCIGSWKHL